MIKRSTSEHIATAISQAGKRAILETHTYTVLQDLALTVIMIMAFGSMIIIGGKSGI